MSKSESILPGAGPFFFEGNNIGILMIHGGGGGTCADLKPLAEALHKLGGYTMSVPLLPGYGTSPEILRTTTVAEWKNKIEQEYARLKQKCDKLFMGGHSMGGLLTLITAREKELDGIFLISTPIDFGSKIITYFAPILNLFIKYHSVEFEKLKKESGGKWVGYEKIPINIVGKLKKLKKEMKKALPGITVPVLLMQGRQDSVIDKNSMDFIYNKIGSQYRKKIWLENNDHPILESPDQDLIVKNINEFLKTFSQKMK